MPNTGTSREIGLRGPYVPPAPDVSKCLRSNYDQATRMRTAYYPCISLGSHGCFALGIAAWHSQVNAEASSESYFKPRLRTILVGDVAARAYSASAWIYERHDGQSKGR